MQVNQVAFGTVTTLGLATIASTVAAATAITTAATVAFSALAVTFGAVSLASMTAWADDSTVDVKSYFENFKTHSYYTISGTIQFVGHTMMHAIIQGVADGLAKVFSRKICGEDLTIRWRGV